MLVNIVACVRIFFFKAKQYFFVSIYATFVDSLIHEGQFGCFCLLAIVNCAAMNTGIQISIPDFDFNYYRHIPRNGIVGPYGIIF